MKMSYHSDTDSLYIDFIMTTGVESLEISPGVVLDYDAEGNVVGIDIDNASKKIKLQELIVQQLPLRQFASRA